MPVRYDTSGKVQPVEFGYMAHPGTCLGCSRIGRRNSEIFASLAVELDHYGVVYLCQDCCAEIAGFILFVPPEKSQELESKLAAAVIMLDKKDNQIAYLKGLLNARIDLAGSSEPISDGSPSSSVSEIEPDTDFIDSILNSV
jgi:hypothetical protein